MFRVFKYVASFDVALNDMMKRSEIRALSLESLIETSAQLDLLSVRDVSCQRHGVIVELLVVVHPYFGGASRVSRKHVSTASGERVRMTFAKYMAHT